jgi:phage-related holin
MINAHLQRIWSTVSLAFLTVYSVIEGNAGYASISLLICLLVVGLDFITGYIASICEGERNLKSKKMRWTAAKLLTYAGTVFMIFIIGGLLSAFESGCKAYTIKIVYFVVLFFTWIETVSNFENLHRIFPKSLFIRYILWFLSVEFITNIPKFERFLKEKQKKNEPETFNNEQ